MSKAFICDVCNRYFSADPQTGAHTILFDSVAGHNPIDICPECTKPIVEFVNNQMRDKQAEYEASQKDDFEEVGFEDDAESE